MGVNTPEATAERRMVSPRSTLVRMPSTLAAMWALSTVCATTDSACSTGTPLFSDNAKLRAKRASVDFRMILPASGARSFQRSQVRRPAGSVIQRRSPNTAAPRPINVTQP